MHQEKKVVLITGATAGIGRDAALYLAGRGHRVIATGRSETALARLVLGAGGNSIETLKLDVTDAASIAAAVATVDQRTGGRGLDALVNNAGYGVGGPTAEVSDADLRGQFDTNVFGLMSVTRAFLPRMLERREGRIVNISSLAGLNAMPLLGTYSATKFALEALSDALRIELRPFGVFVSLIEPGVVDTGFADRTMSEAAKYRSKSSPWAPVTARAEEIRKQSDRTAVKAVRVSRAIARAIEARRPAARYVMPWFAGLFFWLLRRLPTRASDAVLAAATGCTPGRLAPSTTPPTLPARSDSV